MKIKQKKQLNLPQLIEWGFEKGSHGVQFKSDRGKRVGFRHMGDFWTEYEIDKDELFTVEVEEEITEDTEFKRLVCINDNDRTIPFSNFTIRELKDIGVKEFHAYIDGEFRCLWRNGKLVV